MKFLKAAIALLVLSTLTLGMAGCGTGEGAVAAESQTAKVMRGPLIVEITAAGNLALSRTEDLAIDLFYPPGTKGTIASVTVEEGDTVKEGDVLVTLDTAEWEDQLTIMKKALDTAQRNVITKTGLVADAEIQLTTRTRQVTVKQNDVIKAERLITAKELAVRQAELNVQSANETLKQINEVKRAQDAVDAAVQYLEIVKMVIQGIGVGELVNANDLGYWSTRKLDAQNELAEAQEALQEVLSENNLSLATDVKLQIAQKLFQIDQYMFALDDAKIALEDAKFAVEDARIAVDNAERAAVNAEQTLENARLDLTDAEATLEDAKKDYDEALSMSPEIKAPFDGFITKVNVAGGDEVLKGTVAVQIADPDKFEADILVSEIDISKVNLNGTATVTADANLGAAFPARVTHVAPTATISSGVVNYTVKVELTEGQSASGNGTGFGFPGMGGITPSGNMTLPEGFKPPSGNFTMPEGMKFPDMSGFPGMGTATGDFQLREGLTVTVSIIVESRMDTLMVPNGAIITEGFQTYVNVIGENGAEEKRTVTTGISNWAFTEITEGVSEGEQVKVTLNTSLSSNDMRGGMFFGGPPG